MQVRPAIAKDKEAWDTYVDSRPDAAPYCRFAWKDAVEQAYGHKPCYLLAEEAGQIKGILPLLVFRIPLYGSSLVSLPFCDVGDVIAENSDTKQALLAGSASIRGGEEHALCYQCGKDRGQEGHPAGHPAGAS